MTNADVPSGATTRYRAIALVVAAALFMENLDATIIATAAPAMADSLHVAASSIGVAITSYLVTVAAVVPVSGWLSERWGSRRVVLSAVVVFTVASAVCAAATDLPELIAFRALQGIGGALMVPVGQLAVFQSVSAKSQMFRAVALLTWPALLAPVVAPLLGGALATYASWRWIFLINLPIGAVVFAVGCRVLDQQPGRRAGPLDVAGFARVALGLGLLTWTTASMSTGRPDWALCGVTGVACVLALTSAVRHLARADRPLLDLRVLRVPTMRIAFVSGGVFRLCVTAVPFLLTLMFQQAFGWSAVRAGAVVLWLFVGNLAVKAVTTALLRRRGFRSVLRASTAVLTVTIAAAAFVRAEPLWVVIVLILVSGAARSVGFSCLNTIAFADVPRPDLTAANTVAVTLGQLAAGLGVSLAAMALHAATLLPGSVDAREPFTFALLVFAAASVVPVVTAVRAHPSLGDNVRPVRSHQ